jgi:thioredoxin reductase (NADPH)
MLDVVIVGAGPIGLACGIAAKRRGLDALIVEKGALVNSLLGYPTNMEFFSTPDLLEVGGYPLPTVRYKPIREEAIDYYRRVAETEALNIRLYERVSRAEGLDEAFTVYADKGQYACRKVVLATGFFDVPNLMHIPGEDLPKVSHYYREPFAFTGQEVAIIGAKNSAAKAALDCYRHGAKVTMIVRGESVSSSVKYWIKPDLENRIKEGAIKVFFNTCLAEITPRTLKLQTADGPQEIANDWVVALTGYRPDYPLLEAFGLTFADDPARTPICDSVTFETERPGIYLAGTVGGGLNTSRWFIENGRFHAENIMEDVAQKIAATSPV